VPVIYSEKSRQALLDVLLWQHGIVAEVKHASMHENGIVFSVTNEDATLLALKIPTDKMTSIGQVIAMEVVAELMDRLTMSKDKLF
jgi:hypothetical protein